MFAEHPSAEAFDTFLRSTSQAGRYTRNTQVMRHLLSDCAVCRDRLSAMGWSKPRLTRLLQLTAKDDLLEPEAAPVYDYSLAFAEADRAVSAFLASEPQAETPVATLMEEFDSLPAAERVERAAGTPFSTPGVVRALIDRSHALRYKDTEEMLHFASLARTAAEACSADQTGDTMRLADLQARAWGQYGNVLRVCARAREAEEAFATAERRRRQGTKDPTLRAWLLERKATLVIFQGHHDQAVEMCKEAGRVYQDLGENHQFATTLIHEAIAHVYSGEAEQAIRSLNQAILLINYDEDPHLLFAACHNLIWCYVDLDRPDQALMLYNEVRELFQEFDDPLLLLRATWQEGRLLRDLGHLRAAETALVRARKGYQERGLSYEVALVLLDLAAVYVKLGLVEEVKRTVLMTVPIFHALRVKVETLAALLQLQQVADQEQQALELIRTLNAKVEPLRQKAMDAH
jgi:tetratricopeptide (TPR) repeat protein